MSLPEDVVRLRASRSAANTASQCMRSVKTFNSSSTIRRKFFKQRLASLVSPLPPLTLFSRVVIMISISFSFLFSVNASRMTRLKSFQGGTLYCLLFTARILILGFLKSFEEHWKIRAEWNSNDRLARKWATNIVTHLMNVSNDLGASTSGNCEGVLMTTSKHQQIGLAHLG
jgi:hypothetical protein